MKTLALLLAVPVLTTACGIIKPYPTNTPPDREYSTGSNLPSRDRASTGVRTVDPASIDTQRGPIIKPQGGP